jgi:hypothetical protein
MANQRLNIDIVAKDKSRQALQGVQGSLSKVKSAVFNLQNAFIGLGAGLAIRSLVNTGKQIEGLQVRLKFLFGSAKEGGKAFDEMAKFASKVPFSLEEIQAGSGVLAVVSDDAKELANLMKITGNVAAVTGLDFKTTAEQIQRSMSAGISAADLFRDRGVKSMLGFKAGAVVSVEETVAAFERVFGEGGQFDGATDQLAKTLEGTLSMIGDKVFNFKRTLLDAGFFAQLKSQFSDLNKSLEKNSETLDNIAITIGTVLGVAVEKLANGFKLLAKFSSEIGTALKVLVSLKIGFMFVRWARALIPIVASLRAIISLSGVGLPLVAASVAASVATYALLGKELDKIEEKINANNKAFKAQKFEMPNMRDISGEVQKIKEKKSLMEEVTSQIKKQNDAYKIQDEIVKMIKSGVGSVSKSIAESIVLGKELTASFRALAQQILVNIISKTIERLALLGIEKLLLGEIVNKEAEKDNLIRKQNTNLKRQIALNAISGGGGSFMSMFSGRASGGSVQKGQPYMVGERGAELFVPNQSGQIQQSARGGNGGATTVNFNINTVDASGFEELLVRSRGTITQLINSAVNERGSKNLI